MARLALLLSALLASIQPLPVAAAQWGTAYGDPAGFCAAQSWLPSTYLSLPPTSDPQVGNNPEQDTFFGYHARPGYDDWYGHWYGGLNGATGADTGWRHLFTIPYGSAGHWNFASYGWQVHGHAKQYIAYYNWTFGGQCGLGYYGSMSPAPYMADVDGYPVMDIYVDAVPPADPRPRVVSATPTSVTFSWDPVEDRGDGAGADYFAVGFDHYTSWLTVDGGPALDRTDTAAPSVVTARLAPASTACLFVVAADKLGNSTSAQSACGRPSGAPPLPPPPAVPGSIRVNPGAPGLAGLAAWLWIDPSPAAITTYESVAGTQYRIVAQPQSADWDFGDGSSLPGGGFGLPYPAHSSVEHVYATQSEAGYAVAATVHYALSWWFQAGGQWVGGYPLGEQVASVTPAVYPVRQAQPELLVPVQT